MRGLFLMKIKAEIFIYFRLKLKFYDNICTLFIRVWIGKNNACAMKLVCWWTSAPVLYNPYVNKKTSSIFMESCHLKLHYLFHLIQNRTTENLSWLFSVSIVAILPWLFEKLIVDLHLSTDIILLAFQNPTRQERKQSE